MKNAIENFDVCIAKHTLTPKGGVEEELLDFLKDKVKSVVYISHPFKEAKLPSLRSEALVYIKSALVNQIKAPPVKGPSVLFYIKDVVFTVWCVFRLGLRLDLFIGVDGLNALSGYILKKLGRVKKLVFYVIDYSPKRFNNNLMNDIYHLIDRFVCYKADCIWNISDTMIEARKEQGLDIKRCARHITVPHGNRFKRIKRYEINDIERHRIAYFGQLRKEHGADRIIDIFYSIKKEINNASLIVIGTGNMEGHMRQKVKELGITDSVHFKGFVKDNQECEKLLAKSAIGIAPYPADSNNYKYYCDPGKIKIYLACGLPVVMTKVPKVANELQKEKAGFAVEDNIEDIKNAILLLLKDDALYLNYKENAVKMASKYDWENIFSEALSKTLELENAKR